MTWLMLNVYTSLQLFKHILRKVYASWFLVRQLRGDKPSNRGSRANDCFRSSIWRRAERRLPLSTGGVKRKVWKEWVSNPKQGNSSADDCPSLGRLKRTGRQKRKALATPKSSGFGKGWTILARTRARKQRRPGLPTLSISVQNDPVLSVSQDHDIAFRSPALTKAGDGAVHGVSTLWLDHAREQAGTASLHRLEQLISAVEDRGPEGRA